MGFLPRTGRVRTCCQFRQHNPRETQNVQIRDRSRAVPAAGCRPRWLRCQHQQARRQAGREEALRHHRPDCPDRRQQPGQGRPQVRAARRCRGGERCHQWPGSQVLARLPRARKRLLRRQGQCGRRSLQPHGQATRRTWRWRTPRGRHAPAVRRLQGRGHGRLHQHQPGPERCQQHRRQGRDRAREG